MSQSNTEPTNLTSDRITDLTQFVELNITREDVEIFDLVQQIYERQDKQKLARIVFWISVGLVALGTVALILSVIASMMSWMTESFLATTVVAIMDGFFFWGYKQLVQHFYTNPK